MVCRPRQIVLFALLIVGLTACNSPKSPKNSDFSVSLQDGDVAFRRGDGTTSRIVLAMNSKGTYSHVGVVVLLDSAFYVVHQVPYEGKTPADDRIKCEPIHDFFAEDKATHGALYRLPLTDDQRQKIKEYLLDQLARRTPFDHDYDLNNDSAHYCTELVWRAYLNAQIDLSQQRRTSANLPAFKGYYLLPTDLESHSDLQNIYRF